MSMSTVPWICNVLHLHFVFWSIHLSLFEINRHNHWLKNNDPFSPYLSDVVMISIFIPSYQKMECDYQLFVVIIVLARKAINYIYFFVVSKLLQFKLNSCVYLCESGLKVTFSWTFKIRRVFEFGLTSANCWWKRPAENYCPVSNLSW
jgi:hypothetical protein